MDDDSPNTAASPQTDHPLEPARSLFATHSFANVSGPYIAIYLELACRGPITTTEIYESPALTGVSRRRVYQILEEMRAEGTVELVSKSKHRLADSADCNILH